MLSILAKHGSASLVGQFALGLAIAAPVFMFTSLQLRSVQATDARAEYSFADYFTLRVIASLGGLLFILILDMASKYDFRTRAVICLVALAKGVESLSDVAAGLLQKEEKLDRAAISLMIRGVGSLAAFGSVFAFFSSLVLAIAAMVIVWAGVFLVYDLKLISQILGISERLWRFDAFTVRRLVVTSLPLGIVMTLISLNLNVPRYIIQHYLGTAELGIFASLAYMLIAVNLVVQALGQSVTTRLSRMFALSQFREFGSLMVKLACFGGSLALIGVPLALFFGRLVLSILYRPEYGTHSSVLAVMVASAGVGAIGSFLGYGMTAARSFRAQVPAIAVSTIVGILSSLALIPRFGLMGAAESLLLSAITLTVACFVLLRFALRVAVTTAPRWWR